MPLLKKEIKSLTIGSKIFVVHRSYAFQNKWGGKVSLARVTGFENIQGKIEIIFRLVGKSSIDCTTKYYIPFIDINKAIKSIETKDEQKKSL